jgi:hypothetical protein
VLLTAGQAGDNPQARPATGRPRRRAHRGRHRKEHIPAARGQGLLPSLDPPAAPRPPVGSPRGISPLGSHGSRREPLGSPGSCRPDHQAVRLHCQ